MGSREQIRTEYEGEVRERIDWADMEVDESFDGVETCVDVGGSVETEDLKRRAKK